MLHASANLQTLPIAILRTQAQSHLFGDFLACACHLHTILSPELGAFQSSLPYVSYSRIEQAQTSEPPHQFNLAKHVLHHGMGKHISLLQQINPSHGF